MRVLEMSSKPLISLLLLTDQNDTLHAANESENNKPVHYSDTSSSLDRSQYTLIKPPRK